MKHDAQHEQSGVSIGRRNLMKIIGATGVAATAATVVPGAWARPVVELGYLPAHAQCTPPCSTSCIPVPSPIDLVLTVDSSGSIGADLAIARQALLNFVALRDLTQDRISVVGFDTTIFTFSPLSQDKAVIDAAINSLQLGGLTSIAVGIDAATQELTTGQTSGNPRVLLLFSDGQANTLRYDHPAKDQAYQAASAAKAAGIRVMTIAIGNPNAVDFGLMRDMASSPNDFFYVLDVNQLLTALGRECP